MGKTSDIISVAVLGAFLISVLLSLAICNPMTDSPSGFLKSAALATLISGFSIGTAQVCSAALAPQNITIIIVGAVASIFGLTGWIVLYHKCCIKCRGKLNVCNID